MPNTVIDLVINAVFERRVSFTLALHLPCLSSFELESDLYLLCIAVD